MAASSIEEAIVTLIKTFTDVTAYIGTGANARIYFVDAPEGTTTLPYITFFTVASDNAPMFVGQAGSNALLQFDVWHNHKQNCLDLANALVDNLSMYTGTSDGYQIVLINTRGPQTLRDESYDNMYRYIVEAEVKYDR